ncbi:LapA family protein [Rhizobium sp. L1K21]|uniref:LapA family protein n=1 Tax=Rhizobium sp. L1K21 TaxID=2954933 RepID=UPI0020938A6D|nr:LapA family protein [Rhizobium sp. L1K21]MCO6187363.1 LapA family protein [Rhizobium sp. L1K21]
MVKKLINIIILLPIAIVLIVLSVANRQSVTMAFNPFQPSDSVLSVSAPFFIYLFAALILGMIIGSAATWWKQGKHRKKARQTAREAARWQSEAGTQRRRAEELAEQAVVPASSH